MIKWSNFCNKTHKSEQNGAKNPMNNKIINLIIKRSQKERIWCLWEWTLATHYQFSGGVGVVSALRFHGDVLRTGPWQRLKTTACCAAASSVNRRCVRAIKTCQTVDLTFDLRRIRGIPHAPPDQGAAPWFTPQRAARRGVPHAS